MTGEQKVKILCAICKRPLWSKKARELGIGPTCIKKNRQFSEHYFAEKAGQMPLPLEPKEDPTWQD